MGNHPVTNLMYVLVMIGVVVGVDFAFLRHQEQFWIRLLVNGVIVVVFVLIYVRFVRHHL